MPHGTLKRLRVAFVVLGLGLLASLVMLLRSVEARLDTQRRLRHEIVAERIFDEMERELAALLARESERPTGAYDAPDTDVDNWAPFVVGYFTRNQAGVQVLAADQLAVARVQRVQHAASATALPTPAAIPETGNEPEGDEGQEGDRRAKATPAAEAPAPRPLGSLPSPRKQEDVLRQLNRGADVPGSLKPKAQPKARRSSDDSIVDPFR